MFSDFEIYINYLVKSKLFKGLSPEKIESFLSAVNYRIIEFKAGEDIPTDIYNSLFVIKGSIATYDFREDGTKTFVTIFEPQENSMVVVSTTDTFPYYNLNIAARKSSIVLFLDTNALFEPVLGEILTQNAILQNVVKIFFEMTGYATERAFINTESYASDRLKGYIKLLYVKQNSNIIKIPLKRNEMADHLNMDISTVNRELNKLAERGFIEVNGKLLKILDSEKFNEYIYS